MTCHPKIHQDHLSMCIKPPKTIKNGGSVTNQEVKLSTHATNSIITQHWSPRNTKISKQEVTSS